MSQLIARVVASPARAAMDSRWAASLRSVRATAFSLLADRALGG